MWRHFPNLLDLDLDIWHMAYGFQKLTNLTGTSALLTCRQAVACGIVGIFQDSSFRIMFVNPDKYSDHLRTLATVVLRRFSSAEAALHSLQAEDADSFVDSKAFVAVTDALVRVQKIMRFIACLLLTPSDCQEFKLDPGEDTVFLVTFSGKELLERGIAEIVGKNAGWSKLVEEVARTAASSLRLRPQRDRALESLKNIKSGEAEMTQDKLDEFNILLPELRSGMRACEVDEVEALLFEQVQHQVSMLLKNEIDIRKGSNLVNALCKSCKVFSAKPGMNTQEKELIAWMTSNKQDIALNALLEKSDEFEKSGVADLEAVQSLMANLNKVVIAENRPDLLRAAKVLLNTSFRALITEAG